jgi:hypothetical protein
VIPISKCLIPEKEVVLSLEESVDVSIHKALRLLRAADSFIILVGTFPQGAVQLFIILKMEMKYSAKCI